MQPDDVLLSILSFLTFREATTAKILSSWWGRLRAPANIVSLGFPFPLKQRESDYGGYIQSAQEHRISHHISRTNRALNSYEGGHRIDKFKIDIPSVLGAGLDFEKWLEFALSRDTDTINIRIIYGKDTTTYDSYPYFSSFMKKSTLPGLKYVKELSLSGVYLGNYENILTKFVALERLSIESPQTRQEHIHLVDMRLGSCWKLKHLNISNFSKLSYVIVCQLMNLVSLRIHRLESYNLLIENVPKLVDMSIVKARLWKWGFLSYNKFSPHGQLLRLRLYILLDHEPGRVRNYISPNFTKVKHMELDIVIDGECSNHRLFPLIQTCPSMEELEIKFLWSPKPTYKYRRMDKNLIEKKAAIDKLKTMRLSGYRGSVSELEFVLYVVKNATNLKDLIIVEDGDGHKNHAAIPPKKFITRAFKHLRSAIPPSVNFISL